MKVERITLHNFGSFKGTHTIPISKYGLTFVKGINHDEPAMESNGAGKSTLFDALAWGLFGHIPKGDVSKSIVHEGCKEAWVVVYLTDEGADNPEAYIYRWRSGKGSGLTFIVDQGKDFHDASLMDIKATQKLIDEWLGMDREIFHAAVYRAQWDDQEFAEATDSQRKELLSRIIPELDHVSHIHETVKVKLKGCSEKIQGIQTDIQSFEQELNILKSRNFKSEYDSWRAQEQQRIAQVQHSITMIEQQIQGANAVTARRQELQKALSEIQSPVIQQQWAGELKRRTAAVEIARRYRDEAKRHKESIVSRIAQLNDQQVGAACTTCGQTLTQQHVSQETDKLQKDLHGANLTLHTCETSVQGWWEFEQDAVKHATAEEEAGKWAHADHSAKVGQIQGELQSLVVPDISALQAQWQQLQPYLQEGTWPGQTIAEQTQQRIVELHELLELHITDLHTYQEDEQYLKFWNVALSNQGLKSYILDSRIQDMTDAANEWVSALTGGTMWIRFETQTKTQGGKLSEKFNIRVFRHNPDGSITERNFKSWSGGEKKRVSLGIDQGLSQLVADRKTKSWRLLIIDESFRQHMDQGGREAVFDLLEKLKEERDTIFVVDHDPQMAAQFEDQLVVQIKDRTSSYPDITPVMADEAFPGAFLPEGMWNG